MMYTNKFNFVFLLSLCSSYGLTTRGINNGNPTYSPSIKPTPIPSIKPTPIPSINPTHIPSIKPTHIPSIKPTHIPSINPTHIPSIKHTFTPSVINPSTNVKKDNLVLYIIIPIFGFLVLLCACVMYYLYKIKINKEVNNYNNIEDGNTVDKNENENEYKNEDKNEDKVRIVRFE